MKIAMIGQKRTFNREGGIEVVVEELSTRLVKKGHTVYCFDRKSKNVEEIKEKNGVIVKPTFTIEKKSTDALICSFLASIKVLFGRFDVIHYHGIGPSVMLLIPKLFRKKVVVTVHGLNYKTPKWKGIGAKMMKLGEKVTAKYADEIIVLSKDHQKYFLEKYNRKTHYIPNGVTINPIVKPKIIKEKWGLEKNNYLLFLSRIVPGKGLEYLIDAYNRIKPEIPLVIAGDANFVDEFQQDIKRRINNNQNIKTIGFVKGEILSELYSNAKAFIFPSEAEGMPICLLEALSYNTPCLVSDIPENVEVGGKYVDTFENKNTDDLEQKLRILLESPSNIDSRSYVEKEFSWDNTIEQTIKLYEGVKK